MTTAQSLDGQVAWAIRMADAGVSPLPESVYNIHGMSSRKTRRLLNHLCSIPGRRYLEVGSWKGSTLVSALFGNESSVERAVAVDNFSEFDGPKAELQRNISAFLGAFGDRLDFVEADCWEYAPRLGADRFNVYFYDGPHEEVDQYNAFASFDHALEDPFVCLVDDWNHPPVPQGTARAFRDLRYHVLREWVLPARFNGDLDHWWNGLYVAVVRKGR